MGCKERRLADSMWWALNKRFWDNYFPFNTMGKSDRENILLHDLRNLFSYYEGKLQMAGTRDGSSLTLGKITNLRIKNLPFISNLLQQHVQTEPLTDEETVDTVSKNSIKFNDRQSVFPKIFPVLADAAVFLDSPNSKYLGNLIQRSVKLNDLCAFFSVDMENNSGREISGVEAVILFNLLENAAHFQKKHYMKYHTSGRISFEFGRNNSFKISNKSVLGFPADKDVFGLGVRGKDGKSGYGLAVAKVFANLIYKEICGWSQPDADGGFQVSFILGRSDDVRKVEPILRYKTDSSVNIFSTSSKGRPMTLV